MTEKNYYALNCEAGSVHLSMEAIADLAANIARETEGVSDLASMEVSQTKGAFVRMGEHGCLVDLHIVTAQCYNMSAVAKNVQIKVKETLDGIAKVQAQEINVYVDGISSK